MIFLFNGFVGVCIICRRLCKGEDFLSVKNKFVGVYIW